MSYGLITYDDAGQIQFDTRDPGLFFPAGAGTNVTPSNTQETGTWRTANIVAISEQDLIVARPTTGSGFIGMLLYGAGDIYFYAGRLTTTLDGVEFLGGQNTPIQYYKIADAGTLTAPTSGYGLTLWDNSSPTQKVTFTTDPGVGFDSWGAIVGIATVGESAETNPKGKLLYRAPDAATWAKTYVIMNGHQFYHKYTQTGSEEPFTHTHNITCGSYYFEESSYSVYAASWGINDTYIGGKPNILEGTANYNTSFQNDYYVIRKF